MKKNRLDKVLVTNIQQFSLHDGPGIRTTVFLKGCSLHCPWCCNPENLASVPEVYVKDGVTGIYGKYMTSEEIYNEVIKDKMFYEADEHLTDLEGMPGGVTFSGGEALLQIDKLEYLLERLKKESVHMAVETCLFVPSDKLDIAINYLDLFYVDMKILDKKSCQKIECGNLELYLSNLDRLMASALPVVIRIPVIGGYTDGDCNRKKVIQLLEKYRPMKVELIKEHNLGSSKYASLLMAVPEYKGVSDELMDEYKREITGIGVSAEICKI